MTLQVREEQAGFPAASVDELSHHAIAGKHHYLGSNGPTLRLKVVRSLRVPLPEKLLIQGRCGVSPPDSRESLGPSLAHGCERKNQRNTEHHTQVSPLPSGHRVRMRLIYHHWFLFSDSTSASVNAHKQEGGHSLAMFLG